MRIAICLICIYLGVSWDNYLFSEEVQVHLTPPVAKSIVYNNKYEFYVMRYVKPVVVDISGASPASIESIAEPERTVIAYLAAQAQGSFEWHQSLLAGSLKKKLEAKLANDSNNKMNLANEWRSQYLNSRVELTHRIIAGENNIIRCRIVSEQNSIVKEEKDIAVARSKERYRSWEVIDLTNDMVFNNWYFDGNIKKVKKER